MAWDLKQLRSFVAVAEEEHVARAAARLHRSQSPLSRQIRQLEEQLGVSLFERRKQRIYLTELGKQFLREAKHLLSEAVLMERRIARLATGDTGHLEVGFVEGAIWNNALATSVREFRKSYPQVTLELNLRRSMDQLAAIAAGRLELGFVHVPPQDNDGLRCQKVMNDRFLLALCEDHPLASHDPIQPSMLEGTVWAAPPSTDGSTTHRSYVLRACEDAGFRPNVRYHVTEIATALGLVSCGLAIGLFQSTIQARSPDGVVFRRIHGLRQGISTYLVWREGDNSALAASFRDHVVNALVR